MNEGTAAEALGKGENLLNTTQDRTMWRANIAYNLYIEEDRCCSEIFGRKLIHIFVYNKRSCFHRLEKMIREDIYSSHQRQFQVFMTVLFGEFFYFPLEYFHFYKFCQTSVIFLCYVLFLVFYLYFQVSIHMRLFFIVFLAFFVIFPGEYLLIE